MKQRIRDNKVRCILFTKDYGKITAWDKGFTKGDIGNISEYILTRKNGQNIIEKSTILSILTHDGWKYTEIIQYLNLIKILYTMLPEGVENNSIYNTIKDGICNLNSIVGKVGIIFFLQLYTIKYLGYISLENHSLLYNINQYTIAISKGKIQLSEIQISLSELKVIEKLILTSEYYYLYKS